MDDNSSPMTHVSLFSGIGGLDLAAERAGFKTILQAERDPYCRAVLKKHWPNVKRIEDVRDVTSESVTGPVIVVSGGFPCQPFSVAGKRAGTNDDRYLWPAMLRVIHELEPSWVVAENVPGLLSLDGGVVFEGVCTELEDAGFEVLPLVYPAAGVGAWHRRERVFIVAHANNRGFGGESIRPELKKRAEVVCSGEDVSDSSRRGRRQEHQNGRGTSEGTIAKEEWGGLAYGGWWESEPDVGRVAHGIPSQVDRLRALGNAVVPQQAYPIFRAIAEVEASRKLHGAKIHVEGRAI